MQGEKSKQNCENTHKKATTKLYGTKGGNGLGGKRKEANSGHKLFWWPAAVEKLKEPKVTTLSAPAME